MCLAAVSAATGDLVGSAVITAMALVSCVLRFRQEYRSDRAAAALRAMVATTATVVRRASAGSAPVARELPVDQLVPGDVVRLVAGDMVPADLRLLRSDDLRVSQAVLTGESLSSAKHASSAEHAFSAEHASSAEDTGRVAARSGAKPARFGRVRLPVAVLHGNQRGERIGYRDLGSHGLLHVLRRDPFRHAGPARRDHVRARRAGHLLDAHLLHARLRPRRARGHGRDARPHVEAFLFAVSVAVGLTPEMLPVVVTTTLARGAGVMAGRGAIVKRLPAIHNLGAMDVLCTDKTGTLTEDRAVLDCYFDPQGGSDSEVLRWACVNSHWLAECSGAAIGDVLDEALLKRAAELGVPEPGSRSGACVIPFKFARRRATVAVPRAGLAPAPWLPRGRWKASSGAAHGSAPTAPWCRSAKRNEPGSPG